MDSRSLSNKSTHYGMGWVGIKVFLLAAVSMVVLADDSVRTVSNLVDPDVSTAWAFLGRRNHPFLASWRFSFIFISANMRLVSAWRTASVAFRLSMRTSNPSLTCIAIITASRAHLTFSVSVASEMKKSASSAFRCIRRSCWRSSSQRAANFRCLRSHSSRVMAALTLSTALSCRFFMPDSVPVLLV